MTRGVSRGDASSSLTQREFALLEYFMKNAGKPLTRDAIAEQVWRQTPVDGEETNIVDVYVAYLRKKLDTPGEAPMLHTVRGDRIRPATDTPRAKDEGSQNEKAPAIAGAFSYSIQRTDYDVRRPTMQSGSSGDGCKPCRSSDCSR